jgi:hypothetical protein
LLLCLKIIARSPTKSRSNIPVATIARRTRVTVALDVAVLIVRLCLRVARRCAGEYLVLTCCWMAGGAVVIPPVAMFARVDSEILSVMIEGGRKPTRCGVARRAVVAELRSHVIRVCRACVIVCMTLIAILIRQCVVVVHMACDA